MKNSLTIFLALLILLQPFNKLKIIATFELNKAYVVANLCENRETPKGLDCAGRCYLKKQLQAAAEEEATKIPQSLKEKAEPWTTSPQIVFEFTPATLLPCVAQNLCNSLYLLCPTSDYPSDIFHPPSVCYFFVA